MSDFGDDDVGVGGYVYLQKSNAKRPAAHASELTIHW